MKVLMIGDVVGKAGRTALQELLPGLVKERGIDLVVANGENAAAGHGLNKEAAADIYGSGVHVITMGNHVWDKKEIMGFIDQEERLFRPANYPPGTPGRGYGVIQRGSLPPVGIVNLSGRIFMPELDCPFQTVNRVLSAIQGKTRIVLVDFHAEATSEKQAMGWYLDGRATAVVGTHTHVQTADERILPGGTAYITDLGMTGPRDSVIGVKKELVINKFLTQMPVKFETATGPLQFNGVVVDIDESTGKAKGIERVKSEWQQ